MINIEDEGIILEPTENDFESVAVFNPATIEKDGLTHLFYRAIGKSNISTIGYCQLKDNKVVNRSQHPIIFPEHDYETHGTEDPRIVFLEGVYYLFYTAFDGKNARVAYATSMDLVKFEKKGLITPSITYDKAEDIFRSSGLQEKYFFFESYFKDKAGADVMLFEKDAFIFPKKFDGKFALVHRILPGIQLLFFKDFIDLKEKFWSDYLLSLGDHVLIDPKYDFESRNVGGGCPPIETESGWLLIYHAVQDTNRGRIYHACAALLDKNYPVKVLSRLPFPLFSPHQDWEKVKGHNAYPTGTQLKEVVFPTGAVVKGDKLFIYYGAADQVVSCKSLNLNELLKELESLATDVSSAEFKPTVASK